MADPEKGNLTEQEEVAAEELQVPAASTPTGIYPPTGTQYPVIPPPPSAPTPGDDNAQHPPERPALHLNIPPPANQGNSASDTMDGNGAENVNNNNTDRTLSSSSDTPKTPAEKVRFLLRSRQQEEKEEETPLDTTFQSDPMSDGGVNLSMRALFCQMDVLCHFEDGVMGWKESARWLKYEEKVEAGDRWSKPHVATTSLHALYEVRRWLTDGVVLLDLTAPHGCMPQVTENITQEICSKLNLNEEMGQKIVDVLLKPHKHKHRRGAKSVPDAEKTQVSWLDSSVAGSPPPIKRVFKKKSAENGVTSSTPKKPGITGQEVSALYKYPGGMLPENLKPYKPNKRLMKKIPGGSEAANILIGQVDFLTEPIVCFVRLAKSNIMADLSEVSIPTRFLFIVLGPPESSSIYEYEEVGRAVAALLTDRVFCEVAYKARDQQDLVDGLDEFMDDLTVLPPSIWDPATRLDPPDETIAEDKIRRRLLDSSRHAAGPEAFHFSGNAGEDPSLQRTGRLFGGLIMDIKRRSKWYLSDWLDGLHLQCLASIVFLYFACITPIVTFGGLLSHNTEGYMGTMETMLAGAICGLIYALFSGQPLSIVGATGPMLIFETILYQICKDNELHFLSLRFFVGMWSVFFLLLFVAFDLSAFVKYITRFTEESFAVLISLIFIVEAFSKLAAIWHSHPIHIHALGESASYKCHCVHGPENLNSTILPTVIDDMNSTGPAYFVSNTTMGDASVAAANSSDGKSILEHKIFEYLNFSTLVYDDCITYQHKIVVDHACLSEEACLEHGWLLEGDACRVHHIIHAVPDVFFLCCFIFIGTFVIAYFLRNFRASTYFPSIIRSTLSDFAVLLAIVICTAVDAYLGLDTPKLLVPKEFKNTRDDRTWLVDIGAITYWWLAIVAIFPAILAVILIFLDQQITGVIVNRKEHKLKKGHGYHLDLFVLAICIAICSLLGLPWFVAATVRAITHVRSLIKESELRAPGERPQFLGVREQRMTAFCIHILIGVSVFITGILQHIPMAVLYGVFFYMGVTSLQGVQFVQRIAILLMPEKYQPDYIYLRHVETKRVHVFTIIQIICMVIMWIVKSVKKIAILFPLMLIILCVIRKLMERFFERSELYWLDHLLPDETRRKKEDEEFDESEDVIDRDYYADHLKHVKFDHEQPTKAAWHKLIAKRDYGVGRKARPRRRSYHVISRYNQQKLEHDSDSMDHDQMEDVELDNFDIHAHMRESFRERKFSM